MLNLLTRAVLVVVVAFNVVIAVRLIVSLIQGDWGAAWAPALVLFMSSMVLGAAWASGDESVEPPATGTTSGASTIGADHRR